MQDDEDKKMVGVLSRPECTFNYCPHPELCATCCAPWAARLDDGEEIGAGVLAADAFNPLPVPDFHTLTARVERLEAALRRIRDGRYTAKECYYIAARELERAALGDATETKEG